jgi:hypothetical protein
MNPISWWRRRRPSSPARYGARDPRVVAELQAIVDRARSRGDAERICGARSC